MDKSQKRGECQWQCFTLYQQTSIKKQTKDSWKASQIVKSKVVINSEALHIIAYISHSYMGVTLPPEDIWQYLETLVIVITELKMWALGKLSGKIVGSTWNSCR